MVKIFILNLSEYIHGQGGPEHMCALPATLAMDGGPLNITEGVEKKVVNCLFTLIQRTCNEQWVAGDLVMLPITM